MTPSSKTSRSAYARFIPREEVGDVTQWKFGAVDGTSEAPEEPPEALPPTAEELALAHEQALAQARAEAFAQGEAHGQEQTRLEWQQRMDDYIAQQGREAAERVQTLVQGLQAQLEQLEQGAAQEVLELACALARQVVRQELQANPQALLPVVREALGLLTAGAGVATVRLNPQDHAALQVFLQQEPQAIAVQWLADAAVAPGGCQVEQAGMVIDASLDKRWQRAVAALGMASPWEEGARDEPAA